MSNLSEGDFDPNPFVQFRKWFEAAHNARLHLPEAVALATATPEGKPSVRMVLLRGLDERGFVFFTNYESRKGIELVANPHAALMFYWGELERQVRIEGSVERISSGESDEYFRRRPWGSRISAWVSPQSRVIPNREVLETAYQELLAEYPEENIPRPPHWGGFRVIPTIVEFWQGGPNRLHDRLCYRLSEDGSWVIERLAP
jgi:pyridoxamine 5'-phosphate oxidase